MVSKITFAFLCFGVNILLSQTTNIFFSSGSSTLRLNDVYKLYDFSAPLRKKPVEILLTGFADTVGDKKKNEVISLKRINEVKKQLVKNGVAEKNIKTKVFGESAVEGTTNQYNRRVEVSLKNAAATKPKNLNEYLSQIKPKLQKFNVPATAEIDIEGEKGTLINGPANAFVTEDGKPVTGNVTIELAEYYSTSDFISDKMATISNGNLIITGGMINLEAKSGTKKLKLKENTDLKLSFPKSEEAKFATFYGERDKNGVTNWNVDERERKKAQQGFGDIGFSLEGGNIVLMDKDSADKRNSQIQFDQKSGGFKILTETEKKERAVYFTQLEKENKARMDSMRAEQARLTAERNKLYNMINTAKLGMINCDRFATTKDPMNTTFIFNADASDSTTFCILLFCEIKSVMLLSRQPAGYVANMNLPKNIRVKVIAVRDMGANKVNYMEQEFQPAPKIEKKIEYNAANVAPFDEFMKNLDQGSGRIK